MKKPKYNVTIREIYPYNFKHQGIQIHWSCDYIRYGVLTIEITKDGEYEFDTENMGLEFLLIDVGMTPAQLAEKAGISANIISRLKKNEYVSLETIENICKALNCSPNDILEINDVEGEKK
jgi:putative transcriptional regulator